MNLIKRTEKGPNNKVYLLHQKEHNGAVKNLITNLSTKLDFKFSPKELAKSQGPDLTPQRNLTTFLTLATRENEEYFRKLHGTPQPQATRPPPRNNRKPITASYPQDYPKLPTGKSNSWDDRRAKQNKIKPTGGVVGPCLPQTNRCTTNQCLKCPATIPIFLNLF